MINVREFNYIEIEILKIVRDIPLEIMMPYYLNYIGHHSFDEIFGKEIVIFFTRLYNNKYMIQCDYTLNPPSAIDHNELNIRFLNLDEDFIIRIVGFGEKIIKINNKQD